MDASAVADYLKQHPQFFEEYADVVAQIFVPHPHGGHAIPLAERQILALREKNQQLENKLRELIRFGTENDDALPPTEAPIRRLPLTRYSKPAAPPTLFCVRSALPVGNSPRCSRLAPNPAAQLRNFGS